MSGVNLACPRHTTACGRLASGFGQEPTSPLSMKKAPTKCMLFRRWALTFLLISPQRRVLKFITFRHFHISALPSHHASSHRPHSVCIKALAPGRVSEFFEKNKCILSDRMKHCPPPPPYYHMSTFPARKGARKTQVI